jgi:hypothetical protein
MAKAKPGLYFEDKEQGIKLYDASEKLLLAAMTVTKIFGTDEQMRTLKQLWWRVVNPMAPEIARLKVMVQENVAQLTLSLEEKEGV